MENIPEKKEQVRWPAHGDQWFVKGGDYRTIRAKLAEIIAAMGGDDVDLAALQEQVGELATTVGILGENAGAQSVAAAGTNQGNAGTIALAGMTLITGADGTKGVKLPVIETGHAFILVNMSPLNSVKVYPILGGNFLGLTENESVTLRQASILYVSAYDETQWSYTQYGDNAEIDRYINVLNNVAGVSTIKVYSGTISQTGTNAPVFAAEKNTVGSVVWTRNSAGSYTGTLTNAFPDYYTLFKEYEWLSLPNGSATLSRTGLNTILLETYNESDVASDGILDGLSIDITTVTTSTPKVYKAFMSQTGTSAPSATVMQPNSIGDIVWTYFGDGDYIGTLTGAFTENKTFAIMPNPTAISGAGASATWNLFRKSANEIEILTFSDAYTTPGNSVLNATPIEIIVYP